MAIPSNNQSGPGQDWEYVFVSPQIETEVYTRTRPPQLNSDNTAPDQYVRSLTDIAFVASSQQPGHAASDLDAVVHTAESFVGTVPSDESPESTSVTGRTQSQPMAVGGNKSTSELTLINMEQHQRELSQGHSASIAGWISGAGVGERLIGHRSASLSHSLWPERSSIGSSSSLAGQDGSWVPVNSSTDEYVASAGAWSDDSKWTIAFHRRDQTPGRK